MQAPGKPLTGTILGAVFGLFVAIIIQQAGMWPLDRMLAFGAMGILAFVGFLLAGGLRAAMVGKVLALILVVALVGMAAVGATEIGAAGFLTGDCTATADSDLDSMPDPGATSKRDPFDIDPNGTLSWEGRSVTPITDHTWEISVDVAGFPYVAASGGDPNDGLSQESIGSTSVRSYAEDIAGILGTIEIGGIYEVSGYISGSGGNCDALAFVRLPNGLFQGPVALGATALAVIFLIILLVIAAGVRRGSKTTPSSSFSEVAASGLDKAGDVPPGGELGGPEIFTDGFESGDTSSWGDAK